jgi:hypothetical protein
VSNIITDANLVAQYAKKAMEEPEAVITTRAPSESEVSLPGGFLTQSGDLVTTAEVRELNGLDEEAIAKAGSTGKALAVLLQKGLTKLGTNDVTSADLDTLLSGDRDAILIGIRKVTFGDTIDVPVSCQHCGHEHKAEVSLSDDVPVKSLKNPVDDRTWTTQTKKGEVVVALPNGVVQKRLMENFDKTSAEINTLLLSGCIVSINGSPSVGASTALSLSMSDRSKIVEEILTKTPGPRLGEVKKACKACGESMDIPLSLVDLFRL